MEDDLKEYPLIEENITCKDKSLTSITNLNVWGFKVSDLAILRSLPALETAALSANRISTLKDFAYCVNLRELYLRRNAIKSLGEIYHLKRLDRLSILWLMDNPVSLEQGYRLYVVYALPQLKQLDAIDITDEERQQSSRIYSSLLLPSISLPSSPTTPLTPRTIFKSASMPLTVKASEALCPAPQPSPDLSTQPSVKYPKQAYYSESELSPRDSKRSSTSHDPSQNLEPIPKTQLPSSRVTPTKFPFSLSHILGDGRSFLAPSRSPLQIYSTDSNPHSSPTQRYSRAPISQIEESLESHPHLPAIRRLLEDMDSEALFSVQAFINERLGLADKS
jgi:hypothetical protein